MKVGIIGCGFIGTEIAKFIERDNFFDLVGLNDIDKKKSEFLICKLKHNKPKFMLLEDIIKNSDFIIESATKDILESILTDKNLDNKNKKLLIMSTGGLIKNMNHLNKIKNCEILLPSGAIAGLDAIKSVSGRIKSLRLTTTKPIKGLENAPYLIKNKNNLENIKNKTIIFEGNLENAIEGFPQNVNVAATLFLASKLKNIKVKIIAEPNTKYNVHEIEAEGDFGIIKTRAQNLPSKNPKTSYLAVLSAIQAIKNIRENIRIGN